MRTWVFILLSSLFVSVHAQLIDVKRQFAVIGLSGNRVFYPSLNEDGTRVLLTSENYTGLSLYDLESDQLQSITMDEGAGLNPVYIDSKGTKIVYESMSRQKGRVLKTLKRYDSFARQSQVLKSNMRSQTELVEVKQQAARRSAVYRPLYVSNEGLQLNINQNGVTKELTPLDDVRGYLWVSLSPNQKMILFTGVGRGTFICDLNGKILSSLGYLNAPVWFDDRCVVGMVDRDNGHEVISSSIVAVSVDGRIRQTLSPSDRVAMYPSVSSKGNRIAYNTNQGKLYLIEVEKK